MNCTGGGSDAGLVKSNRTHYLSHSLKTRCRRRRSGTKRSHQRRPVTSERALKAPTCDSLSLSYLLLSPAKVSDGEHLLLCACIFLHSFSTPPYYSSSSLRTLVSHLNAAAAAAAAPPPLPLRSCLFKFARAGTRNNVIEESVSQ